MLVFLLSHILDISRMSIAYYVGNPVVYKLNVGIVHGMTNLLPSFSLGHESFCVCVCVCFPQYPAPLIIEVGEG